MYLYTGCRTPVARKLGEGICVSAGCFCLRRLDLSWLVGHPAVGPLAVEVDGRMLDERQALALARRDGFATVAQFVEFFSETHGLPFDGQVIRWRKL